MGFGYAVYFTERDTNRVLRWDPDTGDCDVVAGEATPDDSTQSLNSPYGLTFDKNRFLLIADKHHHRICRLKNGRLEPLPLVDVQGMLQPLPTSTPDYDPTFLCPTGLFREEDGSLLCTFSGNGTICRIHPSGEIEHLLGIPGNRPYLYFGMKENVAPSQIASTPLLMPTNIVKRKDGTMIFIERHANVLRSYHPKTGLRCVFPYSLWGKHFRSGRAPDRGRITEYHPVHPSSVVLGQDDALYLTDSHHACALYVDGQAGEVRKVIDLPRPSGPRGHGIAAMAFGDDGTAWILNSADQAVEAFAPTPAGPWKPLGVRLSTFRGAGLQLPRSGSGLALGN